MMRALSIGTRGYMPICKTRVIQIASDGFIFIPVRREVHQMESTIAPTLSLDSEITQ